VSRLKPPTEAVFAFTVVGAGWGIATHPFSVWEYATGGALAVAFFLAGRSAR
jgi:hypothetical protein